jgi:hypothetical protein
LKDIVGSIWDSFIDLIISLMIFAERFMIFGRARRIGDPGGSGQKG